MRFLPRSRCVIATFALWGGVFVLGLPPKQPLALGPCSLYLDATGPLQVLFFAGRSWQLGVTIPSSTSFAGTTLHAQAGFTPSSQAPFGLDLSHGLRVVAGQ